MAIASIVDMMKVGGYMVKNPTTPDSSSRSKGGTEIGVPEEFELIPIETHSYLQAEEYNSEINGLVTLKGWAGAFLLRSHDNDAYSAIYGSYDIVTSTNSGKTLIKPVAKAGGRWLTDKAVKFLFVPNEPDLHPGVLFTNAVLFPAEASRVRHLITERWGVPLIFKAFPDASGNPVQWGRLEDMTI
jgi:hypothetical protein